MIWKEGEEYQDVHREGERKRSTRIVEVLQVDSEVRPVGPKPVVLDPLRRREVSDPDVPLLVVSLERCPEVFRRKVDASDRSELRAELEEFLLGIDAPNIDPSPVEQFLSSFEMFQKILTRAGVAKLDDDSLVSIVTQSWLTRVDKAELRDAVVEGSWLREGRRENSATRGYGRARGRQDC